MKKRLISVLVFVTLLISTMLSTAVTSFAADNSVNITLPNFKVIINGQVVNNDYSKYPFIVYKDITYFPMTFSDCRFLGLESTWTGDKTGLLVDSTDVTAAYNLYLSSAKNRKNYTAQIANFPIKVNGKAIDNSKEEYPLLSFRDITYFPLTWKYSADEFGWDYQFDGQSGLVIKSKNAKLDQIQIPKNRLVERYGDFEGKHSIAVMAKNGYAYYVDNKGTVMQAPLSDISKAKKIFQLEIWSRGDGKQYDLHDFYEENGKAMLFFHSGGAVMGSDHRYILKEDGTAQKIQSSYYETTLLQDKLYMYWVGPTPGPGNLRVQDSNGSEDSNRSLGSAGYWYYFLSDVEGLPKLELIGNELYVRAAKVVRNQEGDGSYSLENPAVYKVNTFTNEVTRVSQSKERVVNAQIVGEYLYYLCSKGEGEQCIYSVYKHSLKDGTEAFIGSFAGEDSWQLKFAAVGDHVYYLSKETLYRIGESESLNPKAEAISMSITGDKKEYLACTFRETPNSKYRVMVFDESGEVVFKTSDCGSNVVVEGSTLQFYNITTETFCKTTIK